MPPPPGRFSTMALSFQRAWKPAAIVETLHRATAEILATPGFHQRMAAIGVDVLGTTPAAYAKIIADDYDKWGKVVAAAGLKPE